MTAWGTILFYAFTEINKLMDFEGVKDTLSYSTIYRDQLKQSFIEEVQSRRETRYTNHYQLIITNFRQLATSILMMDVRDEMCWWQH